MFSHSRFKILMWFLSTMFFFSFYARYKYRLHKRRVVCIFQRLHSTVGLLIVIPFKIFKRVFYELELKPCGFESRIRGMEGESHNISDFLVNVQITFYQFLVSKQALWDKPNIELKYHGVQSDKCFWPLSASITSEVKINYAYVIMQGICNKLIEVNFCGGCMVSRPNRLQQH